MTSQSAQASYVARLADLSPRQFAALIWLALGFTRLEVAKLLGTTVGSADQYRQLGMRRAGLRSTADLVRRAIREGLVELAPTDLERDARAWVGDPTLAITEWIRIRDELHQRVARLRAPAPPEVS